MCVLNELTMSEVIEGLIRDWVNKNEKEGSPAQAKPAQEPGPSGKEDISDRLEEQAEKA
jgi:hypothetical protein